MRLNDRFDAAIFDSDGTLIHTPIRYVEAIISRTLRRLGKSKEEANAATAHAPRFWYEHGRTKFIQDGFDANPNDFWRVFHEMDVIERAGVMKGYNDVGFLRDLKRYNIKRGIVTGSPKDIMNIALNILTQRSGVEFDCVVSATDVEIKSKPDPEGILKCLNNFGVHPERAFFVGNGCEDIYAAKAAGVFSVHVDRGEYALNGAKPDLVVKNLYEIPAKLGLIC